MGMGNVVSARLVVSKGVYCTVAIQIGRWQGKSSKLYRKAVAKISCRCHYFDVIVIVSQVFRHDVRSEIDRLLKKKNGSFSSYADALVLLC